MHIAEGVLSAQVLTAGAGIAIVGTALGLKNLQIDKLLMTGVLAAFFFIASLVHIPIGFSSAHLIGNGLLGIFLGLGAFPAILAALLLQALLLHFGGITVLGVNTATMALGAYLAKLIYTLALKLYPNPRGLKVAGFLAGVTGVLTSALLTSIALTFTEEGFVAAAYALVLAHIPIMLAEGLICMLIVTFVAKMQPEYLNLPANFQMKVAR